MILIVAITIIEMLHGYQMSGTAPRSFFFIISLKPVFFLPPRDVNKSEKVIRRMLCVK